jgi:hypothetical protein
MQNPQPVPSSHMCLYSNERPEGSSDDIVPQQGSYTVCKTIQLTGLRMFIMIMTHHVGGPCVAGGVAKCSAQHLSPHHHMH